jgi:hypothetical protein
VEAHPLGVFWVKVGLGRSLLRPASRDDDPERGSAVRRPLPTEMQRRLMLKVFGVGGCRFADSVSEGIFPLIVFNSKGCLSKNFLMFGREVPHFFVKRNFSSKDGVLQEKF